MPTSREIGIQVDMGDAIERRPPVTKTNISDADSSTTGSAEATTQTDFTPRTKPPRPQQTRHRKRLQGIYKPRGQLPEGQLDYINNNNPPKDSTPTPTAVKDTPQTSQKDNTNIPFKPSTDIHTDSNITRKDSLINNTNGKSLCSRCYSSCIACSTHECTSSCQPAPPVRADTCSSHVAKTGGASNQWPRASSVSADSCSSRSAPTDGASGRQDISHVPNSTDEGYISYKCDFIGSVTAGIYDINENTGLVKFQISDQLHPILVDTGSSTTLCHQAVLDKIDPNFVRWGPDPGAHENSAYGVDGKTISFTKTCFITFTVQGHSFELRFLVSPDCGEHVFIIGRDSLRQLHAIYDAGTGILTIPRIPEKVLYTTRPEHIPPNSEKLITLTRPFGLPDGMTVLGVTEKLHPNSAKLISCMNIISDSQQPAILLRNKSNTRVNLHANMAIAKFTPLSDFIDGQSVPEKIDFSDSIDDLLGDLDQAKSGHRSMLIGARGVYTGKEQYEHSDMIDEDDLFDGPDNFKDPPHPTNSEKPTYDNRYPNINLDKSMLNDEQKRTAREFFRSYRDCFANGPEDIKVTHKVPPLEIPTGDATPVNVQPYPMSVEKKRILQGEIDKLVKQGVLKPINQPLWRFPSLLVSKKSGEWRMVCDLRQLNQKILALPAHPLPRLVDFGKDLKREHVPYHSLLDISSMFHQLPLSKDAQKKCVLGGPTSSYSYCSAPQGLSSSPSFAQEIMDTLLGDLIVAGIVYCYIDDIFVTGGSWEKALHNMGKVLDRIRSVGLRLKSEKCECFMYSVTYLGRTISPDGIGMDKEKLKCVQQFSVPKSKKDVMRFLGLSQYFSKAIPNLSCLSAPLYDITKKNTDFEWTKDHDNSFRAIKAALQSPETLAFPHSDSEMILSSDACTRGLAAMLSQYDKNGVERPIGYVSRRLSDTESRYSISEIEMAAVLLGIEKFHEYIVGRPLILRTDHRSLSYIKSMPCGNNSRLARWSLALQRLQFTIQHVPGVRMSHVDSLSRVDWQALDIRPNMSLIEFQNIAGKFQKQFAPRATQSKKLPRRSKAKQEELDQRTDANINPPDHTLPETDPQICNIQEQSTPTPLSTPTPPSTTTSTPLSSPTPQYTSTPTPRTTHDNDVTRTNTPPLTYTWTPKPRVRHTPHKAMPVVTRRMARKLISGKQQEKKLLKKIKPFDRSRDLQVPEGPIDDDLIIPGNDSPDWPEIHNPELGIDLNDDPNLVVDWSSKIETPKIDITKLRIEQPKDEFVSAMTKYLKSKTLPKKETLARQIAHLGDKFTLEDGLLFHHNIISLRHAGARLAMVPVIPKSMQRDLIKACHDTRQDMHDGINKTIRKLTLIGYWLSMLTDARNFIAECPCQMVNVPRATRYSQSRMRVDSLRYQWSLDVLFLPKGTSEATSGSFCWCLVAVENFSRYIVLSPLKHLNAECICSAIFNDIFCKFGAGQGLHTDRGSEFTNIVMAHMLNTYGVQLTFSPATHKMANGLSEIYIKLVRQKLRLYLVGRPHSTWPSIIQSVAFALNVSPQIQTSGYSALEIMIGSLPIRMADSILLNKTKVKGHEAYMKDFRYKQEVMQKIITTNLKSTHEFLLAKHNRLANDKNFAVGSQVWLFVPRSRPQPNSSPKLEIRWKGPYSIHEVISKHLYILRSKSGKVAKSPVHANRLRHYVHPTIRPSGQPTDMAAEMVSWATSDESIKGTLPPTQEQCQLCNIRYDPSEEILLDDTINLIWEDPQSRQNPQHWDQLRFQGNRINTVTMATDHVQPTTNAVSLVRFDGTCYSPSLHKSNKNTIRYTRKGIFDPSHPDNGRHLRSYRYYHQQRYLPRKQRFTKPPPAFHYESDAYDSDYSDDDTMDTDNDDLWDHHIGIEEATPHGLSKTTWQENKPWGDNINSFIDAYISNDDYATCPEDLPTPQIVQSDTQDHKSADDGQSAIRHDSDYETTSEGESPFDPYDYGLYPPLKGEKPSFDSSIFWKQKNSEHDPFCICLHCNKIDRKATDSDETYSLQDTRLDPKEDFPEITQPRGILKKTATPSPRKHVSINLSNQSESESDMSGAQPQTPEDVNQHLQSTDMSDTRLQDRDLFSPVSSVGTIDSPSAELLDISENILDLIRRQDSEFPVVRPDTPTHMSIPTFDIDWSTTGRDSPAWDNLIDPKWDIRVLAQRRWHTIKLNLAKLINAHRRAKMHWFLAYEAAIHHLKLRKANTDRFFNVCQLVIRQQIRLPRLLAQANINDQRIHAWSSQLDAYGIHNTATAVRRHHYLAYLYDANYNRWREHHQSRQPRPSWLRIPTNRDFDILRNPPDRPEKPSSSVLGRRFNLSYQKAMRQFNRDRTIYLSAWRRNYQERQIHNWEVKFKENATVIPDHPRVLTDQSIFRSDVRHEDDNTASDHNEAKHLQHFWNLTRQKYGNSITPYTIACDLSREMDTACPDTFPLHKHMHKNATHTPCECASYKEILNRPRDEQTSRRTLRVKFQNQYIKEPYNSSSEEEDPSTSNMQPYRPIRTSNRMRRKPRRLIEEI